VRGGSDGAGEICKMRSIIICTPHLTILKRQNKGGRRKTSRKEILGRPRHRWEDSIKIDPKEIQ
jgi:hypothetical protein